MIGARLTFAVVQVAVATRRRRAHHRMVVDLVGVDDAVPHRPQVATCAILDVAQPLAYCLPGVRSRVVVSEGTLNALADNEIAAILTHERAHLRARHDLVLEMFTAVHAAFPRFVRSANALDAVRLLIELLADDAAVRAAGPHSPGPRPGRLRVRAHAVGRAGRRRSAPPCCGCAGSAGGRNSLRPCGGRLPRRGRGARGAHRRARGAVADRTASAVHRASSIACRQQAAVPQQQNERLPE